MKMRPNDAKMSYLEYVKTLKSPSAIKAIEMHEKQKKAVSSMCSAIKVIQSPKAKYNFWGVK